MGNKNGFTLLELMIVISIIGVLATIGSLSYSSAIRRSQEAKALADMKEIKKAMLQLEVDSDQLPRHSDPQTCIHNAEAFVNECEAGLTCTDGSFPNWNGPYLDNIFLLDEWNRPYYFDPDYHCHSNVKGCEKVANHATVRVIHSLGKDGVQGYADGDGRDRDNIVLVLCPL